MADATLSSPALYHAHDKIVEKSAPLSSFKEKAAAVTFLVAPLPFAYFAYAVRDGCSAAVPLPEAAQALCVQAQAMTPTMLALWLTMAMVGFFFWGISLVLGNCSIIDLYWTVEPPYAFLFYATHATALPWAAHPRWLLTLVPLLVWSVRLSYNYLRREEWHVGAREDWRFHMMRQKFGIAFVVIQFFTAFGDQALFLYWLTLPLWPIATVAAPLSAIDFVGAAVSLLGVLIEATADAQLRRYMLKPRAERPIVLRSGLWYYSRHPNYMGEILFWTGLWIIAAGLGMGIETAACPATIILLFYGASVGLTESRLLEAPHRKAAYQEYQASTPAVFPIPFCYQLSLSGGKKKDQ